MPILRRVVVAALAAAILSTPAPAQNDDPQRAFWIALKRQLTGSDTGNTSNQVSMAPYCPR